MKDSVKAALNAAGALFLCIFAISPLVSACLAYFGDSNEGNEIFVFVLVLSAVVACAFVLFCYNLTLMVQALRREQR